jgi:hypothetical protein
MAILDADAGHSLGLNQEPEVSHRPRAGVGALGEDRRVGIDGPELRHRQCREHRPPRRRQVGRQPHADLGDQRHGTRWLLLEQIEHLAADQDAEVSSRPGGASQPREDRPTQPLEPILAEEGGADLEGGDPEAVDAVLGETKPPSASTASSR